MQITRWSEYGILLALLLAREQLQSDSGEVSPLGADEVAFQLSISVDYVHQISQKLKKAKLIRGVKGPGGGFLLVRKPAEISMKDIIQACEGTTFELICDGKVIHCDNILDQGYCPVRSMWIGLRGAIDGYLESKTLADMVEDWSTHGEKPDSALVQISKHHA